MKVLLIGARGFIGSALLAELIAGKQIITCVTRGSLPEDSTEVVKWRKLESSSQRSWDEIFEDQFDVVYHLGWSTTPRTAANDPASDFIDNVGGSLRLISAIRNNKSRPRFIFSSSGGTVYGRVQDALVAEAHPLRPISSYGLSKLAFENVLLAERQERDLDSVSVRISNPYGPSQKTERAFGAVSTFIRNALDGQTITVFGSSAIVRDFIYISDVVKALVQLANAERVPPAVNLGSGTGASLEAVISAIETKLNRRVPFEISSGRDFDIRRIVLDTSLLKSFIDWSPTVSLQKGIDKIIDDRLDCSR